MGLGAAMISILAVAAVVHSQDEGAGTAAPAVQVRTSKATPPHLVMMVLDDLGWTDVGFHGSDFPTPNIDKLAKEGVILDKYYVQQVCSPTRSALMTARYPFRTGLQHTTTLMPGSEAAIPKDTSTIAEVLKRSGYSTHAIGKWHLGFQGWDDTPIGRGFESHAGYLNGAIDYYHHDFGFNFIRNGTSTKAGLDFWRNKTAAWDYDGKHTTGFYMEVRSRHEWLHGATSRLLHAGTPPPRTVHTFTYLTSRMLAISAGGRAPHGEPRAHHSALPLLRAPAGARAT